MNRFAARENLADRMIGWLAPQSGMKRLLARSTLAAMREQAETARAYDGASRNVRGANWKATGTSGTAELTTSLAVLRNRSRDLIRNNPYVKHALRVWAANMVALVSSRHGQPRRSRRCGTTG